jgi:GNAT superfamily N-acetyltransferase
MMILEKIAGMEYGICEGTDFNEMVILLAEVFSRMDPPAIAAGITAAEFESFVGLFASKVEAERLTIVARSIETGEMAGALLAEDSASFAPDGMEQLSKKFDPIFHILGELESEYRHGSPIQSGECLHLFLLGVASSFGGRGISQNLVAVCLQNGLQRGYRLAVTEATNNVSQHVFRKLGFADRVRRSYRDYAFQGATPFAKIQGHSGPILMDKAIV